MPKDPVDEILDEAAAAEKAADEKSKADEAAKAEASRKPEPKKVDEQQRSLDDLIKDPKIREQIKSVRGWSDAQLDSSYQMAPMQEEMAKLKTEKKYKDFGDHEQFINDELKKIAIFDRTPDVMERLYWMAKGKHGIENPKKEDPQKKSGVVGERIHTPYPSNSSGSGEGRSGAKESTLTDEQKQYAAFLGVPEDRYEAAKKGYDPVDKRRIRPPEKYEPPKGGNSADVALGIMMKRR